MTVGGGGRSNERDRWKLSMKAAAQDGGRSLSRGWRKYYPCSNGTDTASFSFSWKSFYTGVSIRKYPLLIDVTKSFVEDVERLGAKLTRGAVKGENKVSVIFPITFKWFLLDWIILREIFTRLLVKNIVFRLKRGNYEKLYIQRSNIEKNQKQKIYSRIYSSRYNEIFEVPL